MFLNKNSDKIFKNLGRNIQPWHITIFIMLTSVNPSNEIVVLYYKFEVIRILLIFKPMSLRTFLNIECLTRSIIFKNVYPTPLCKSYIPNKGFLMYCTNTKFDQPREMFPLFKSKEMKLHHLRVTKGC